MLNGQQTLFCSFREGMPQIKSSSYPFITITKIATLAKLRNYYCKQPQFSRKKYLLGFGELIRKTNPTF